MQTRSIDAVIKDYIVLIETLEEIQSTIHNEYYLIAGDLLHSLQTFNTLFGLRLAHLPVNAAEQVSLTLQKKGIVPKYTVFAVDAAEAYYQCIGAETEFDRFI